MKSTLKFLTNFFGKTAAPKAPSVLKSPIERVFYFLAALAYNRFMSCSFRAKVWFLLLCLVSISWVNPERCMYLFAFFESLDLENAIAAMFPEENSKLMVRRSYSDLRLLGLIAGFAFFVHLSYLGVFMFRAIIFFGNFLYSLGPGILSAVNSVGIATEYVIWVMISGVGNIFYWLLLGLNHRLGGVLSSEFTEPLSEKICLYFFDPLSKEDKSLLVRFCHYLFDKVYKGFMSCSFRTKAIILFVYFLVVLHLVFNNYHWILSPFARDVSYASNYIIAFRIEDRKLYPIIHGVYAVSWLYVIGAGAILCSNLSPERMLRHQYLLLFIPYFRSYFLGVSSTVFLILAIMLIRACFFYKKRYLYFISVPAVFVLLSLFLLDLTICLVDLGEDNFLKI